MEFNSPSSAYVHIPFCRRRCFYCDFPISVVGDRRNGTTSTAIAHYTDALCSEIRLTPALGKPLKTVFFGGGTPSLLSVAQLNQILAALDQHFGIDDDAEISMEVDPGTFDLAQIRGYRAAGVNRVSLGVQAFQAELLSMCGRTHTVDDVYAAMDLIRQVGLENISLDLISGLPNQTVEQWQASLECAIALSPTHLSAYDLTIEPQTVFGKQYSPGAAPLPSDELTAAMYCTADRVLTAAGYQHYEISNYAQPGYQCRHNRVYWENRSFYGFGMGATSYVNGDRRSRPRKTKEYYEWLDQQQHHPSALSIPEAVPSEMLLDTLMVGLRLAEGLSLERLAQQFGAACVSKIWICLKPYQRAGWVEVVGTDDTLLPTEVPTHTGRLRLTTPEGFLFSNVVLVKLFEQFDHSSGDE
ncbi:radical SAM family heme chaperone HemW [Myxacorys almedinensis]|uniref:Heme chaperone HemW n=1 Tax=Myxacorys almedinensis A TaxID=2690445 RepID=A0A8J7Z5A2_9CYAN|nr:radical SAM family heme chaperone HemW [Myxacorys almedinensis]NDJ18353.1 coproporphyrinogen III oxidase [Myxacorys almedinensis A]